MITRQSQHRTTRVILNSIQSLICNLRLYGCKLGIYNDCDSNALYLVLNRMQDLGLDASAYAYLIVVPPRNYGGEKTEMLKPKWRNVDEDFKEACNFTKDKLVEKFSQVVSKHNQN